MMQEQLLYGMDEQRGHFLGMMALSHINQRRAPKEADV